MSDEPRWKAYTVRQSDAFEYETVKYGVREEYPEGATRYIHNEVFDSEDEAQMIAARFNIHRQKGKTYDNVMKTWS